MKTKILFKVVFVLAFLFGYILPAAAQDGGGGGDTQTVNIPNDPNLVNQVVNNDGTVNVNGMTDLGVVTVENVPYMPTLPGGATMDATFHQYMSNSGAVVLIPTTITDLAIRLNGGLTTDTMPDAYYNPGTPISVQLGADYSNGVDITVSEGGTVSLPSTAGYYTNDNPDNQLTVDQMQILFDTLGDYNNLTAEDIWSQLTAFTNTFLSYLGLSYQDFIASGNLLDSYALFGIPTTILIYTDCSDSMTGCTEAYLAAQEANDQDDTVIVIPPACSPPYTTTGPIVITGGPGAGAGGKLAPVHPVVVGQDPQRRGVDIQAWASIPPIIYHYYDAVQRTDQVCVQDNVLGTYGTGCEPYYLTFRLVPRIWYECVAHTRTYTDYLGSATVTLSLTQNSRNWILTDLAQSYPGAHLIRPDFSFSIPGPGSISGGNVIWSHIFPGIQLADPGYWVVTVRVNTTGTAVSAPRFATVGLGTFLDELVRVTLVGSNMYGGQP